MTKETSNKILNAIKEINAKMVLSFAVGLLSASIVIGIVYLSSAEGDSKAAEKDVVLTEEEMKEQLAAAGYIIHTEEEWDELVGLPSNNNEGDKTDNEEPAKNEEAEEEAVRTIKVTVTKGMTSIDIGKVLEKEKFIDNAFEFSKAVENKGVANRLQLGTFEVNSGMSTDEIIAVFFS